MMLVPLTEIWRRSARAFYTRLYGRLLGVAHGQVDISGPCVIHGGGRFCVGKNVVIRATPRLPVELYCASGGTLTLGDGCFLNQGVHLVCCSETKIGEEALLADEVLVMDADFHGVGSTPTRSAPVILEPRVWVGARAIILKGVVLGEGSVVGAGSVVTRSVPARALAVGNPARVIRTW